MNEQSRRVKIDMSLPRPGDGVEEAGAASSSSSLWRRNNEIASFAAIHRQSKVEESDDDLFTVPDVELEPHAPVNASGNANGESQNQGDSPAKRRRGRNPVDKEYRRIKRLLRNRVSAQQARERKKVYVNDLESREKELHDSNLKLEEKISTLINENNMLRKVLMNTRPKTDENVERKA